MSHKPHPDDVDVALVIRDLQNHSNSGVSIRAKQLWKKWSVIVDASPRTKPGGGSSTSTDNPFAMPAEEGHPMRTWSDNSGTFKIEAVYIRADGDNVVLKREDGKEIRVPLGRLSKADQVHVEGLQKGAALDNPFD